jgi:superfamily II DNA helicase RecQ
MNERSEIISVEGAAAAGGAGTARRAEAGWVQNFLLMQLKIFSVPALHPAAAVEEMNGFLRAHRILSLEKQLVGSDAAAFWAVCVQYLERNVTRPKFAGAEAQRPKVAYKEILSGPDFAVFARLREVRKGIAERDGVPPYAVFTNEQLAAMVTEKSDSLAALARIEGVGASRLEKYGAIFLNVLQTAPEVEGTP